MQVFIIYNVSSYLIMFELCVMHKQDDHRTLAWVYIVIAEANLGVYGLA